jgi:putative AlgH/UPF0301 family transcriptional regulator
MSNASNKSTLLIRRLYRSLLKTAQPFTATSRSTAQLRSPVVLHCLLHRTGLEDESWLDFLRGGGVGSVPRIVVESEGETLDDSDDTDEDEDEERPTAAADVEALSKEEREMALFRTLLRDVMCGSTAATSVKDADKMDTTQTDGSAPSESTEDAPSTHPENEEYDDDDDVAEMVVPGQKRMQFPIHVDTERLRHVIRREFRLPIQTSDLYDLATRQNVAFRAIRELNKKLTYASELEAQLMRRLQVSNPGQTVDVPMLLQQQAAKHVAPLPLQPTKSYLRPGAFLLAHPNMTGYFRRSVICILDHRSEEDDEDEQEDLEEEEDEENAKEPKGEQPEEEKVADAPEILKETASAPEGKEEKVADPPPSAEDTASVVSEGEAASASSETAATTTTASDVSETETTAIPLPLPTKKRRLRPKRRNKPSYGTYGLVINRVSVSPNTGKTLTLTDILRPLPMDIVKTFGRHPVREGGPVHMALQMIYQVSTQHQEQPPPPSEEGGEEGAPHLYNENPLEGTILPPIQLSDDATSVAADSDKAVYFRGSILNAVRAVDAGRADREDIAFFVGASCWSVGQLEKEMEHGFWLPCRGPTTLAQSGICEHETAAEATMRPEADLWLSMMSACGSEEAKLALLLHWDDGKNPNGAPCDS